MWWQVDYNVVSECFLDDPISSRMYKYELIQIVKTVNDLLNQL